MAMKKISVLSMITIFSILSGCSIQKLSYFQVEPYAKPFTQETKVPLNIVLMEDVKGSVVVEGDGAKKMTVTDFRKSFGESLKKTLERNFELVNLVDSKPDTGLSLIIYRVRPFWRLNSQSSSTIGAAGIVTSTNIPLYSAAFQFETSLLLNNEKLENADLTVYSDEQMTYVKQAHKAFKSGLIKTCETINKEIFTDEVVEKLRAALN
jgi:hypothetical protein